MGDPKALRSTSMVPKGRTGVDRWLRLQRGVPFRFELLSKLLDLALKEQLEYCVVLRTATTHGRKLLPRIAHVGINTTMDYSVLRTCYQRSLCAVSCDYPCICGHGDGSLCLSFPIFQTTHMFLSRGIDVPLSVERCQEDRVLSCCGPCGL